MESLFIFDLYEEYQVKLNEAKESKLESLASARDLFSRD